MSTSFDLRPVTPADERPRPPSTGAPAYELEPALQRLTPRLLRYVTRRLGDRHEAEEVVQETLLRAHQHQADLRTEDELAAWTTVVAGRLAVDRLRVRGRSTSVAEVPEGDRCSRDTADVVVARDEARTALDALDAMAPRQAAMLWAREVEGLDYASLGKRFALTEAAVRSLLARARQSLRKEYASRGGTLPAGGVAVLAPWLDGLTWLGRLRRSGVRTMAGPLAVGSLGLAVLGGGLVAPALLDPPRAPYESTQNSLQRVRTGSTETAGRPAATAVAPVRAGEVRTSGGPGDVPARRARLLDAARLADVCTDPSAPVRAGDEDCVGGEPGALVVVRPPATVPALEGAGAGVELPHSTCAVVRSFQPRSAPRPDVSAVLLDECTR